MEDFQVVKRTNRKRRLKKRVAVSKISDEKSSEEILGSIEINRKYIASERESLLALSRRVFKEFSSSPLRSCKSATWRFICIGLGSISHDFGSNSILQLSFFLELKQSHSVTEAIVFEPVLTPEDCLAMMKLELQPKKVLFNFEDHVEDFDGMTFVFLPHCVKELNLEVINKLQSCGAFRNTLILGNCLESYVEDVIEMENTLEEIPIEFSSKETKNVSNFYRAFNNSCFIYVKGDY